MPESPARRPRPVPPPRTAKPPPEPSGSGAELRPGDRVELTPLGEETFPKLRGRLGTCRRRHRKPELVTVLVDGAKHATGYHRDFWRRVAGGRGRV